MIVLRKTLFYLCVLIFVVAAPLLVLYALGYLYQPGGNQGIVKAGLIYLDTVPRGASIHFSHKRFTQKTPAEIRDLRPGTYEVKLTLKDHIDVKQALPVAAGKATVLDKILLVPKRIAPKRLVAGPFAKLLPFPGSQSFLLQKTDRAGDLLYFDGSREMLEPLFAGENRPIVSGEKVISVLGIPASPQLILRLEGPQGVRTIVVRTTFTGLEVREVTNLLAGEPGRLSWEAGEERHLFAFAEGELSRIDVERGQVVSKLLEGLRGYGFHSREIYALTLDGSLLRTSWDARDREVLVKDPRFLGLLLGEKGFFQIHPFSRDYLFFLGEKGKLAGTRIPYRYVKGGILGLELDPRKKELLVWKRDRIGVLSFPRRQRPEDVFERGPKLRWLYRDGVSIEKAFWVYDGSHILFQDGEGVYLMSRWAGQPTTLYPLFRVREGSVMDYSERFGRVSFLQKDTGDLVSWEVLPRAQIGPITLPDFEGFELSLLDSE